MDTTRAVAALAVLHYQRPDPTAGLTPRQVAWLRFLRWRVTRGELDDDIVDGVMYRRDMEVMTP